MERDHHVELTDGGKYNFNSHAHVERDKMGSKIKPWDWSISTHTLTWSVTLVTLVILPQILISTHTLTWSVTVTGRVVFTEFNGISTHTLTWSVTATLQLLKILFVISTHTLTWSVTIGVTTSQHMIEFQLTRSRGA